MTAIGDRAPAFILPDTDGTMHEPGGTLATVVVFTCNHCPYALAWHERIVGVAHDYADRGVRVSFRLGQMLELGTRSTCWDVVHARLRQGKRERLLCGPPRSRLVQLDSLGSDDRGARSCGDALATRPATATYPEARRDGTSAARRRCSGHGGCDTEGDGRASRPPSYAGAGGDPVHPKAKTTEAATNSRRLIHC
jgi:hypothetical protein